MSEKLTPKEEIQMDLFSNAIIDLILSDRERFLKIPLPYQRKSNKLVVKGSVKMKI